MQTLEVTDDQYAIVQQLRDEIGEHVVGKYGHVRERDAVQFLIDNLHDELELEPGTASDEVEVSEKVADGDADLQTVSYDETESVDEGHDVESSERRDASVAGSDEPVTDGDAKPGPAADQEADGAATSSDDGLAGTPGVPSDSGPGDDVEPLDDGTDGDDDSEPLGDGADGAAADDEMLDEMMNLLRTHDDKWEEAPSGDARYAVTLPDGSVETVQTKDDVRALLFKNYRSR
ncbi:hypothetical protein [Natronococcus sp.]|uniref:hypothetical protein n=1 Tax=Natronococcus sp. TaxID=35747 RepID=UPI0025FF5383|nr:hypothetical protein [Natronococcus sp.]